MFIQIECKAAGADGIQLVDKRRFVLVNPSAVPFVTRQFQGFFLGQLGQAGFAICCGRKWEDLTNPRNGCEPVGAWNLIQKHHANAAQNCQISGLASVLGQFGQQQAAMLNNIELGTAGQCAELGPKAQTGSAGIVDYELFFGQGARDSLYRRTGQINPRSDLT